MLPRHKKALSDMKSAEKKLKDARIKYTKTKQALSKAQIGVADAKAVSPPRKISGSREPIARLKMTYAIQTNNQQ